MTFQEMAELINAQAKARPATKQAQNKQKAFITEEMKDFLEKMKNWSGEHGSKNK